MNLVRLTTGEEIVCKLEEDGDFYVISEGVIIVPTGDGKVGMVPFVPYGKGDPIRVKKQFVMFVTEPHTDIEDYVRRMLTGIQVPPKQGIVV